MDLRKLIEEIVPWLVIAAMYLPWLRKKLRKQKEQSKRRPQRHFQSVAHATVRDRAFSETRPEFEPALPEEGVSAIVSSSPVKPIDSVRPHFSPEKRELRKAIALSEILKRKY